LPSEDQNDIVSLFWAWPRVRWLQRWDKNMIPEFDCQSCGACCKAHPSYEGKRYVSIYPEDAERMTPQQKEDHLIETSPGHFAMKLVRGLRCSALSGEIGSCVSCKIYETRPDVCRGFEKDDDSCHFARTEAGLGPFGNL
jgi:Fe-S-cluster containining protein